MSLGRRTEVARQFEWETQRLTTTTFPFGSTMPHWRRIACTLRASRFKHLRAGPCCRGTVSNYVNGSGKWNMRRLNTLLPDEIVCRIRDTIPPRLEERKDEYWWKPNPKGEFTVKHTYRALEERQHQSNKM
ncbi:hypothetical protein PIB30_098904 [Stylosanthes scabra]|uniref:Uncharacterized protein n=1 Tax=Stylosanthes scabra TaxID=79078 RepID=A0ABU6YZL4_9FABA|nr:hypothetical protein [Stylosanthes scabra]